MRSISYNIELDEYDKKDEDIIENKLKSFNALKSLLHGEKIDLDKEREERNLS